MAPYNPKRPTRPIPITRQAACLRFAAVDHTLGYWQYLARVGDNPSYKLPAPLDWMDLPEALADAAELLTLVAELAILRGDERLRADLRAAIDREEARFGRPGTVAL